MMIKGEYYRELHRTAKEYGIFMLIRDDTVKVFWDNPKECLIIQEKIEGLGLDILSAKHCRDKKSKDLIVSRFTVG